MPFLGFLAVLVAAVLGLLGAFKAFGPAILTAAPTPSTGPVVVTQARTKALHVAPGAPVELHLAHRWRWTTPRVTGPAKLQRIDYVVDPGYDAWLLHPGGGTVVVTATGQPGPRRFRLTILAR